MMEHPKVTFSDLKFYKDIYDDLVTQSITNKNLAIIAKKDEAQKEFIKIGRIYYQNARLSYSDIMKLYIKEKKEFDSVNNKNKIK